MKTAEKFFLLFFLSVFLHGLSQAQTFRSAPLWKQVDSLAGLGQPKSALAKVNLIYDQAKKNKHKTDFIQAVLYKIRLNADFQEDFILQTIGDLRAEIKAATQPEKQILQSILAEVYWKYYQQNQFRFRDRTQLKENKADSINTWDLITISREITDTYLLSLENPELLKSKPIKEYEAILENMKNAAFRPSLYDFLAWRALEFFMSGQVLKNQSPDTATTGNEALRIFNELSAFHANDKDPRALIDLELKRLDFIHEISFQPEKDSVYLEALKQLERKYLSTPWSTDITYTLAQFFFQQGQRYRPLQSDKYRLDILVAERKCEEAIQRFPGSEGAGNCKILLSDLRQPSLQLTLPYAITPDKPSLALLEFKNIPRLTFRLLTLDPENFSEKTNGLTREQLFAYFESLPQALSWELALPEETDHQQHSLEIDLPQIPSGFYILMGTTGKPGTAQDKSYTYAAFWSSQIGYISQRNETGGIDFYLIDRENGQPIAGAIAEGWVKNYNYKTRRYESQKLGDFISGKEGHFSVPPVESGARNANLYLKIRNGKETFYTENFYQYPVSVSREVPSTITRFFTDRAIYRPGQTIFFKGIMMMKSGETHQILANKTLTVVLNDANNQKLSEQTFTTNEFGSFNGSFIAPMGVLAGQMSISTASGFIHFRVEEYKRPSFEVVFNPMEGNYRLGEKITVHGKAGAYAGNPVSGAKISYRVVRTARFPWWSRSWYWPTPASPAMEITNGFSTTDETGNFSLDFKAIPDLLVDINNQPVFTFEVYADVTDINGETQSSVTNIAAGYRSLLIETNLPEGFDPARDSLFNIRTTNLNGRSTPAQVTMALYRLEQPERSYKPRLWERPDLESMSREEFYSRYPNDIYEDDNNPEKWEKSLLLENNIHTLTDSVLNIGSQILGTQPGRFLLVLKSKDPFGQEVEKKHYFIVFHSRSNEIPVNALCWFTPLTRTACPGETARFLIGTTEEDLNVLFEIRVHDSLFSRQWIKLNQEQRLIEIPVLEAYRGNFSVNFNSILFNRSFQYSQVVSVPYADKNLGIVLETFRNKLDPGQNEEWKIRIYGPDKKPVNAELLAGMYDASLDVFQPNNWTFNIYRRYFSTTSWDVRNAFKVITSTTYTPDQRTGDYSYRQFYQLNWFGLNYFGGRYSPMKRGMGDQMNSSEMSYSAVTAKGGEDITLNLPSAEKTESGLAGLEEAEKPALQKLPGIQIRRDFRETAFFYPSLVTDSTGSIILKFTAPESLTRWKFMGLAHTSNLEIGHIEKELTTRKELMVFPNAPRFVRQGDTLVFSTKVVNLSGNVLDGTVTLSLKDPISLKTLDNLILNSPTQKLASWRAGELVSSAVEISWKIYIPNSPELSALQYRVTAVAGNFSDGEEKIIPVLTNRMMVTETLPLPVRGKGSFNFSFDKLINTSREYLSTQSLKNYRLTLEFASNPAWYAVQALPSLSEKKYPNADALFTAFYANSIASFIANSNPKIKAVFESWLALTPSALWSNLEKNQDLKSAMLQETPWVTEARNETERKQRLGMYFNTGKLELQKQEDLMKLKKLQSPNGAWPWFEGMPESRYITQNIITGLGHLIHLGIIDLNNNKEIHEMVEQAIAYLDRELKTDFELLKKNNKGKTDENHLGTTQIQYLYARSYFMEIPMQDAGFKEAFEYYQSQADKYWLKQDQYLQGMIALALNRLGHKETPGLIVKSLSEKALHSEEMGMYWAVNKGWLWYQAPIETQAMMIEVFDEVARDKKSVEDQKIWLLKQKQTLDWKTPRATAEAVYALLLRGCDLLAGNPEVKITLGKEMIDSEKLNDTPKEAGTGYFRYSWTGESIKPEMGKISVSKSSDGIAWGAVYWQYFENLDKITLAATPLKLEKQLFIEKNSASGPVLQTIELTNSTTQQLTSLLHVGDKLKVRIILTVDRDMEFVHMKDMRASAFEPLISNPGSGNDHNPGLSGYRYQDGLGYYQSVSDQSMNFFFDVLPRGTYVFEYPLKVNAAGEYSNGITTIQCLYAPEFSAHSEGSRIMIRE